MHWSQLPRQINEGLTHNQQLLFAIYLGLPIGDIKSKIHERKRQGEKKSALALDENGLFIQWPHCVQAIDTDAALNHELDFFKLCELFGDDPYLAYIPAATLAFAAGYPELMETGFATPFMEAWRTVACQPNFCSKGL